MVFLLKIAKGYNDSNFALLTFDKLKSLIPQEQLAKDLHKALDDHINNPILNHIPTTPMETESSNNEEEAVLENREEQAATQPPGL